MTASNKELAGQAQATARRSEGLPRQAASCVIIALTYSTSVAAARSALEELGRPDVRGAALQLVDQLAADMAAKE